MFNIIYHFFRRELISIAYHRQLWHFPLQALTMMFGRLSVS